MKAGRNRPRSNFNLRGRLTLVGIALGLCSVTLIGRAAYVQLVNRDFTSVRAKRVTCANCPSPPRAA